MNKMKLLKNGKTTKYYYNSNEQSLESKLHEEIIKCSLVFEYLFGEFKFYISTL